MGQIDSLTDEVTRYLASFDNDTVKKLLIIRKIIQTEAPFASEGISYGLIGFKLNGKPLVYIGAFTHHIGLYATPSGHEAFKKEFAPYKQGKGSVQFPLDQPLPLDLIKRIVKFRKESIMQNL